MTFDEIKSVVIANLRGQLNMNAQRLSVDALGIGIDWEPTPGSRGRTEAEFYSVLFALVTDGIIVPGSRHRSQYGDEHYRYFPYYAITSYGRHVLEPSQSPVIPQDELGYIAEARKRIPTADDTIFAYLVEATQSFNDRRYLSSTVMLGIAGEALLEWLYVAFIDHLPNDRRATFEKSFDSTRLRTQKRFQDFLKALALHEGEFAVDLWYQVQSYLENLSAIVKVNRDDVAHRRANRVDKQLALGNLTIFLTLLSVANELANVLSSKNCTVWSKKQTD